MQRATKTKQPRFFLSRFIKNKYSLICIKKFKKCYVLKGKRSLS